MALAVGDPLQFLPPVRLAAGRPKGIGGCKEVRKGEDKGAPVRLTDEGVGQAEGEVETEDGPGMVQDESAEGGQAPIAVLAGIGQAIGAAAALDAELAALDETMGDPDLPAGVPGAAEVDAVDVDARFVYDSLLPPILSPLGLGKQLVGKLEQFGRIG
jgi:hypothetical protein